MLTFDGNRVVDARGTQAGAPLPRGITTRDGKTVDSTGAFLVGELERLDQETHMPLSDVTYARDIDLREDVTIADEATSYTLSTFAAQGASGNGIGTGKAWIGKNSDQITGIDTDIAKVPTALGLWGMELKYTIPELVSAAKLGRPVDQQKYEGLQLKWAMDTDEQVYIGDSSKGLKGLVNSAQVTPSSLPAGLAGSTLWSTKTPDEILADVNLALATTWKASAVAVMPNRMLLPLTQFSYIATAKVSSAGNMSILKYILENNLLTTSGQGKLEIFPSKWLDGAGTGGTLGDATTACRMVVYNKQYRFIRFPMTMLDRTPVQYDSIYHKTTYYGRLGGVEMVYPETVGYFDGL